MQTVKLADRNRRAMKRMSLRGEELRNMEFGGLFYNNHPNIFSTINCLRLAS